MCLTIYYVILMTHYCQLEVTSDLNYFMLAVCTRGFCFHNFSQFTQAVRKVQMEMNILNT